MIIDYDVLDSEVEEAFETIIAKGASRLTVDTAIRRVLKDTLINVSGYLKDIDYEMANVQTRDMIHQVDHDLYHLDV